jgi:hypothetical protein
VKRTRLIFRRDDDYRFFWFHIAILRPDIYQYLHWTCSFKWNRWETWTHTARFQNNTKSFWKYIQILPIMPSSYTNLQGQVYPHCSLAFKSKPYPLKNCYWYGALVTDELHSLAVYIKINFLHEDWFHFQVPTSKCCDDLRGKLKWNCQRSFEGGNDYHHLKNTLLSEHFLVNK